MKFLESLKQFTELPTPYGSFHLAFFIPLILLCFICAFLFRKCKEKYFRIFIAALWIIMVVMECIKLVVDNTAIENEKVIFTFYPSALSFQFCSLPLYFLPVVAFAKNGKIRDVFILFLGTYGLMAGLVVYLFPSTIFSETLYINYQTMIHHGIQLLTGFVMLIRNFDRFNLKVFFKNFVLFFFTVMGARLLNELFHSYYPQDISVDFFYISPYTVREFPVFGNVKQLVPNSVFVFGYIFGFTFLAFAIYAIPALFARKWNCFKYKSDDLCMQN